MRVTQRGALGLAAVAWLGIAVLTPPAARAQEIAVAGSLFVELDAADASAGTATWVNTAPATIGDFVAPGALPVVNPDLAGMPAVTFGTAAELDIYQSPAVVPAGLVGNSDASIEAWVYNTDIPDEETIVSWGHRGGPDGTNLSFNYGRNATWGAVGHWGSPDLGWDREPNVPEGTGVEVPVANQWHHLVYTFDGTTQRVYADGQEWNSEDVTLDVFANSKISIAAQNAGDGVTPELGLRGTLSIGRLRVHDGALTAAQVLNNFTIEWEEFRPSEDPPLCDNCPVDGDSLYKGKGRYVRWLTFSGFPPPTSSAVVEPAGATLSTAGRLEYALPDPEPASFAVTVESTSDAGTASFSWTVTLVDPPDRGDIEVAEELLVELFAEEASAGSLAWLNSGTQADFLRVGVPVVDAIGATSAPAVTFNGGTTNDAYQCAENAAAGIVGPDPTRSIEVWAYNPEIVGEETMVAFGRRGGPDGSNVSFNYAQSGVFGAVGHWGAPDIGWKNEDGGAPPAGEWHHLVYTYDGTTTRVYSDGVLQNTEELGAGRINTHPDIPITLAAQNATTGGRNIDFGQRGTLSIGQVRVHDGVLSLGQLRTNYELERELYGAGPIPPESPVFVNPPGDEVIPGILATYSAQLTANGYPTPGFSVTEPAGAAIDENGLLTYDLPDPLPESFTVTVVASNDGGEATATWVVSVLLPEMPPSGPVHLYPFTVDASDVESGANGTPVGDVTFEEGQAVLPNLVEGATIPSRTDPATGATTGAYIDLPNGIVSALAPQATFEAWVTWGGPSGSPWQRLFDFGTAVAGEDNPDSGATTNYVMMTPWSGSATYRAGYRLGTADPPERILDGAALPVGEEVHVVLVWDDVDDPPGKGVAVLYRNGVEVARDLEKHLLLSELVDNNNWLGRSQFGGDSLFVGSYNEFRIYDYPLTPAQVLGSYVAGPTPDDVTPETLFRRGDTNASGDLDITDGVFILNYLFLGGPEPPCLEGADTNGDNVHDLSDGVFVLNYLFLGGDAPPAPGPETCGPDPDGEDDGMGCASYPQETCGG